jgi:hypothetical protein
MGGAGEVGSAARDGTAGTIDPSPSRASTRDSRDVATRPSALVARSSHLLFLFSTLDDDLELLHCEIGASEGSRCGVRGRRAARRGPGCDRVFFSRPPTASPKKRWERTGKRSVEGARETGHALSISAFVAAFTSPPCCFSIATTSSSGWPVIDASVFTSFRPFIALAIRK